MAKIGHKNRLISFYKPSGAVNTANESAGWTLYRRKWAEITGRSGVSIMRSTGDNSGGISTDSQVYSFRINYDLTIDITMRIQDSQGISYDILTVTHDHAQREDTFVVARHGAANG